MQELLKQYLIDIKDIKKGDKELTYRTYLENFLNKLFEKIKIKKNDRNFIKVEHEPKMNSSGGGIPDFAIYEKGLSLGYIELKAFGKNLAELKQSEQIKKYFERLSENIILSDYLNFHLLRYDEKKNIICIKKLILCEYEQLASLSFKDEPRLDLIKGFDLKSKAKECEEFFKYFLDKNPKPINSALSFAEALSGRTKMLNEYLQNLKHNQNSKHYQELERYYEICRATLYENISFEDFCDNFCQTLIYTLFIAKLSDKNNDKITFFNIKTFIPPYFPLLKSLSDFMDTFHDLKDIKWLSEEILNILNHLDKSALIQYFKKAIEKNIFEEYDAKTNVMIHFYETFLRKYNFELRKNRGAYYTPYPIVKFIIKAIDECLQKDFNMSLNQASKNEYIKLLDFATGSGTFLLEALRQSINKDEPKNEIAKLISRFYGFEYLVAPYAIAHFNIAYVLNQEYGFEFKDNERLQIYLTNTLEFEKKDKEEKLFFKELIAESNEALSLKTQKDILIITGNPPYSGASANKNLFEDEVRLSYGLEPKKSLSNAEDFLHLLKKKQAYKKEKKHLDKNDRERLLKYKKEFEQKKLKNEKNPKWLLDDYVKFINFAQRKIIHNQKGIVAIITNHSFIDNPTFRGMRYNLMQNFDELYILDLHGNDRKKEKTQEGLKDENVFNIRQGVSINFFIKKQNSQNTQARVFYSQKFGLRKDKFNFLLKESKEGVFKDTKWQELSPYEPFYLFVPQNQNLWAEYNQGWSVKDIFRVSGVGICSKRDKIVFHNSKESLKTMLKDFISKSKDELYKVYDIGKDSGGWKLEWAVNEVKKNEDNLDDFIVQCHYRPFDYRWTYYTDKNCGFMARPVYEVFKHLLQGDNKALLVSRQSSAVGNDEMNTMAITDKIVDINFYRRGGESIMPLYIKPSLEKTNSKIQSKAGLFDEEEIKPTNDDMFQGQEKIENFTPEFRKFIDEKYQSHFEPEQILAYIYAVLFHKHYREKYIDFLKTDFPKIPFVQSKEKFLIK